MLPKLPKSTNRLAIRDEKACSSCGCPIYTDSDVRAKIHCTSYKCILIKKKIQLIEFWGELIGK